MWSLVRPDATAFPHRNAFCSSHVLAGWSSPAGDRIVMDRAASLHRAIRVEGTCQLVQFVARTSSLLHFAARPHDVEVPIAQFLRGDHDGEVASLHWLAVGDEPLAARRPRVRSAAFSPE